MHDMAPCNRGEMLLCLGHGFWIMTELARERDALHGRPRCCITYSMHEKYHMPIVTWQCHTLKSRLIPDSYPCHLYPPSPSPPYNPAVMSCQLPVFFAYFLRRYEEAERIEELLNNGALDQGQKVTERETVAA